MLKNDVLKALLNSKSIQLVLSAPCFHSYFIQAKKVFQTLNFIIYVLKQNFIHGPQEILGLASSDPRAVYCAGLV
jgi:hypothetical protein